MVIIVWRGEVGKAVALPEGAKSCFPCLACELIEVTDEAVDPELPFKRLDFVSFLSCEPERLRPDQVSVLAGFYGITNIYDVAVFGDWAKSRNGDSARTPGKHFLCDHRFDAEGPKLHRGSSNIPNDCNGPIVAIWHYSGNHDSRLRWFKSEANPGEKGLLHRDHGSDLSEGRVSGITHCARGTSGFGDGISCVSFLTICNVPGEANGIAQGSRLYAKDNCLPIRAQNCRTPTITRAPVSTRNHQSVDALSARSFSSLERSTAVFSVGSIFTTAGRSSVPRCSLVAGCW